MAISVQIHPDEYEVKLFPPDELGAFAVVRAHEGDGTVTLFLPSPAACDDLIRAAAEAKTLLLLDPQHDHDDAGDPWVSGAHEFIPCTTCTADACNACSRPAADAVHAGPCCWRAVYDSSAGWWCEEHGDTPAVIAGDSGPQQVTP